MNEYYLVITQVLAMGRRMITCICLKEAVTKEILLLPLFYLQLNNLTPILSI